MLSQNDPNVQKFFERRPLVREGTWLEVAAWCFGGCWIPIKSEYDKVCAHYAADALRHDGNWAFPIEEPTRDSRDSQRSHEFSERAAIVEELIQPPSPQQVTLDAIEPLQSHIRQPGRNLLIQDLPPMSEPDLRTLESDLRNQFQDDQPPGTPPPTVDDISFISSPATMLNISQQQQPKSSPKSSPQKRVTTPLTAITKKKKKRKEATAVSLPAVTKVRFLYIAGIAGKMSSLTRCKYLVYWVPSDCAQGEPTITWETAAQLNKYTPEMVDYTLSGLRIPIKESSTLRVDTDKYGVLDAVVRNLTKRNNTAICDLEYTQDSDETKSVNLLANYQDLLFERSGAKYKIKEWSLVI